jgi:hypothetical protein
MDIAKFISMLELESIWLARADTFSDKHEGRFPNEMRDDIRQAYQGLDGIARSKVKDVDDFQDYLIKNTFISCWHHNLEENMVMWEIYGRHKNAVAVQTTGESFEKNVDPTELSGHSLIFKDVVYKDAEEISGVLRYEDCFFRKRRHFSFEKEVRVSLDTYTSFEPTRDTPQGHKLSASLNGLIKKVVVHPDCPDWFLGVTKSIVSKYNLRTPVERGRCGNG